MDHHAADLFFIPARAQHAAPRNKRLSSLENRQQGRRSRMSDAKTKVFLYIIHKKIAHCFAKKSVKINLCYCNFLESVL